MILNTIRSVKESITPVIKIVELQNIEMSPSIFLRFVVMSAMDPENSPKIEYGTRNAIPLSNPYVYFSVGYVSEIM